MRLLALGALIFICSCGQPDPDPSVPFQPDTRLDRSISFGLEAPYRLGDGQSVGSSCQEEISGEELSGTRFEFDFELTGAASNLNISLEGICGVDYENNVVAVMQNGKVFSSAFLGSKEDIGLTTFRAEPGKYTIIVESGGFLDSLNAYDLDDFLIKKLSISSNQSLKKGEVRVQRDANRINRLQLSAGRDIHLGDQGGDGLSCTAGDPVTNARTIEYRFRVPASGAVLSISDPQMCSVNMNQNDFFLLDSVGGVKLYSLVTAGFTGAFPSLNLPAGDYGIQVRSNPELQGTDFDDFLVQSMDLWSTVPLTNLGVFVLE